MRQDSATTSALRQRSGWRVNKLGQLPGGAYAFTGTVSRGNQAKTVAKGTGASNTALKRSNAATPEMAPRYTRVILPGARKALSKYNTNRIPSSKATDSVRTSVVKYTRVGMNSAAISANRPAIGPVQRSARRPQNQAVAKPTKNCNT